MATQFFTIRWRAPVMSLVGVRIDGYGEHMPVPSTTAVAGLLGAALGLPRGDPRLSDLADAFRHAVVVHQPGTPFVDFQTADLTAPYLPGRMWWVDEGWRAGVLEREGSREAKERRTQVRPLIADADMTVVVEVLPGSPWSAEVLMEALRRPAFALYLGRASCPPTGRLAGVLLQVAALEEAAAMVGPGVRYLPAEVVTSAWGDLVVNVPCRNRGGNSFVLRQ